ncbi:hypothetical protein 7AX1_36 [uncultured Caudovirales phage]|uniref:Uncharacterized protein n=1 Tax=uncultured Caudovirales phage TaxID=2100421 RepID=A0A2H4IZ51_9CAUD|nr:hypothetical protein 7AX1_36 [uncultured Caudovirales phage]
MKDEVSKTEVISNNEIIFLSTINNMYIKSVDEDNIPIEYTKDIKYALSIPNTINFKNSTKYLTLITNKSVIPINKVTAKTTTITTEEL